MTIPDLNDLYFFAEVVDHGGFAPAGRALGIPKSRLSRRVAELEGRLGVQLIMRSTRSFAVTEVGRRYHAHCRAMITEAQSAEESVAVLRTEPCGLVRISCPVALLAARVGPMIAGFLARYPRVTLQMEETNRKVDVVAEGLDLAIRVRPPPLDDSDLVMRVLSDRAQCLVASPDLIARHGGMAMGPADLAEWPTMDWGAPQEVHRWVLLNEEGQRAEVLHRPRYVTGALLALRDAAVAGVGVVQLPRMFMAPERHSGALIEVVPGWAPRREIIHCVYASRRGQLPAVRALIDYLADAFAQLEED